MFVELGDVSQKSKKGNHTFPTPPPFLFQLVALVRDAYNNEVRTVHAQGSWCGTHTVLYPKVIAQLLVLTSALILDKSLWALISTSVKKAQWFCHFGLLCVIVVSRCICL